MTVCFEIDLETWGWAVWAAGVLLYLLVGVVAAGLLIRHLEPPPDLWWDASGYFLVSLLVLMWPSLALVGLVALVGYPLGKLVRLISGR